MARLAFCRNCGRGTVIRGVDPPGPCVGCGLINWRPEDEPADAYTLTHNDRRFLKSIRIAADDPEDDDGA